MAKKMTRSAGERRLEQSITLVDIGSLTPHGRNPRQGDVGAVMESIARNGWYGAVLAYVPESGEGVTIIVGEHRWRALGELQRHGMDLDGKSLTYAELAARVPLPVNGKVPVIVRRDLTDAQALRIMLADNRTSDVADYDTAALAEMLQAMAAEGEAGLSGSGWDGDALEAMTPLMVEYNSGARLAGRNYYDVTSKGTAYFGVGECSAPVPYELLKQAEAIVTAKAAEGSLSSACEWAIRCIIEAG